ncbi:MAG: twitching motility protein PilI [Gallionellaceae bacterium]|nr:MAG: twitching motility protein PilI [Gallionellaceae bacterium]
MSNRLNLREFQQGLIDRIRSPDTAGARASTLGVQIAGQNFLVEMGDIAEVLPLPPLTIVPFVKPWFRGVANVRGNLYCVVDMAAYSHGGATAPEGQAQAPGDANNRVLLVAERHGINAALLVDCVLGLRDARTWLQSNGSDQQIEYRDERGAIWRKLDVRGLVGQEGFLQIGG